MNNTKQPLQVIFQLAVFLILLISLQTYSQFTWTRTFGGLANDEALTSIQTRDGNYVVVGDSGYGTSSVIIKFSKQGDIIWKKIYTGADRVYIRTAEDPSGNLYFNTLNGILKINSAGNTLWNRSFSGTAGFQYLKFTDNNKYLICYGSNSLGKVDSSGHLIWFKNYSNTQYPNTYVLDVLELANSYYITGIVQSTVYQGFIRKLDTAGNEIWSKYTTAGSMLCSIVKSSSGSLIVSGNKSNFLYCRKLDLNGNTNWERTYTPDSLMNGYSIIKAGSNKFALATGGYGINSRFVIIDSSGNVTMNKIHFYAPLDKVMYLSISTPNDSGFIITGYIKPSNVTTFNWLVVKTDKNGNTTPIGINQISRNVPNDFKLYQNYPNPFNPSTKIKFEIPLSRGVDALGGRGVLIVFTVYDVLGREVYVHNESKPAGIYEMDFNGTNLTTGVYFYTLESGIFTQTKKMLMIK